MICTVVCAIPQPAAARIFSDRAAALVTFPFVSADASQGVDTTIQLSNVDTDMPTDVACFLERITGHCGADPSQACADANECGLDDFCLLDERTVTHFSLRLTAAQPIQWQLSTGLAALPLPQNAGAIPPAPADPFVGLLRCIVTDADGLATNRNVLQGEATTIRYDAASAVLDAAKYNAVAIATVGGAGGADGRLILGEPSAEYEGCPETLMVNHFFDHVLDPASGASQILTTLTLTPCTANLYGTQPPLTTFGAQIFVVNEFEMRFSTSRKFTTSPSVQLSLIDTSTPSRSIFSAGVQGTLTGVTSLRSIPGSPGFVGIAVERHESLADAARVSTAAFNLHSEGERATPDVIELGPCALRPRICHSAASNSLVLSDRPNDRRDKLAYKWRKGAPTDLADFGDPTATAEYALCIHAGTAASLVAELRVPPSSSKWRRTRQGFGYADATMTEDGVRQIRLKRGSANRSRAAIVANGESLPPLPLAAPLALPVVVQIVNSDTGWCVGSSFEAGDVQQNEVGTFEARSSP